MKYHFLLIAAIFGICTGCQTGDNAEANAVKLEDAALIKVGRPESRTPETIKAVGSVLGGAWDRLKGKEQ